MVYTQWNTIWPVKRMFSTPLLQKNGTGRYRVKLHKVETERQTPYVLICCFGWFSLFTWQDLKPPGRASWREALPRSDWVVSLSKMGILIMLRWEELPTVSGTIPLAWNLGVYEWRTGAKYSSVLLPCLGTWGDQFHQAPACVTSPQ